MDETKNQMSLLDAIGLSDPATEQVQKKSTAKTEAKAPRKRRQASESGQDANELKATSGGSVARDEDAPWEAASDQDAVLSELPDLSAPLPLESNLCFALYSANHAMHGVYKSLLKEIGLTYPQFLAMTVLWETNNVPVGAVTSRLQLDTNTLTPLLKRLEAMDLLTRTRSVKDERQVILKLTRKGRALQKKTEHFGKCIFSAAGLPFEEIVSLQKQVMKLRDNLRKAGLD